MIDDIVRSPLPSVGINPTQKKLFPETPMKFGDVCKAVSGYPGGFYLASPYSKFHLGIEAAWIEAAKITGHFAAAGLPVYSPIVHSHPAAIYGGFDPYDYEIWMPLNEFQMGVSEGLIVAMMEGWRQSFGIGEEIKWFEKRKQPVFYLDVEGLI